MMTKFSILLALGISLNASAYEGSTFREVVDVLDGRNFVPANEVEKAELDVYKSGQLPQYAMNMSSVFAKGKAALERDAKRTISDKSDYFPRLQKLLHPNGVCVIGKWDMTEANPYSGYFQKGSQGLFIGRVSVAMEKTTSNYRRGFDFYGKILPSQNENEKVKTTNFFTVDILLGEHTPRFLETAVTNEPETGFKLSMIKFGLKISKALKLADKSPMFRPVSPIAKIGAQGKSVKAPHWVRVSADNGTIMNDEADFRREVLRASVDNRKLKLKIEVSDTTKDRHATQGWTRVGVIEVDRAIVSYGCDRQLHFAHPKLDD